MSEYLLGIMGVVLISSILNNILPNGKTSTLIRGIIRLCAYLLILSPVYEFVQNRILNKNDKISQKYFSETVIEEDLNYIEYCSEKSIHSVQSLIKNKLLERYGVSAGVEIVVESTKSGPEGIKILYIELSFDEINEVEIEKIKNDLSEEYKVKIEIIKGG